MWCAGLLWWLPLLWSMDSRARRLQWFQHVGLSDCGFPALEHRLSSCGVQAYLFHGLWDLLWSGIKPVSPAFPESPVKSLVHTCIRFYYFSSWLSVFVCNLILDTELCGVMGQVLNKLIFLEASILSGTYKFSKNSVELNFSDCKQSVMPGQRDLTF